MCVPLRGNTSQGQWYMGKDHPSPDTNLYLYSFFHTLKGGNKTEYALVLIHGKSHSNHMSMSAHQSVTRIPS